MFLIILNFQQGPAIAIDMKKQKFDVYPPRKYQFEEKNVPTNPTLWSWIKVLAKSKWYKI